MDNKKLANKIRNVIGDTEALKKILDEVDPPIPACEFWAGQYVTHVSSPVNYHVVFVDEKNRMMSVRTTAFYTENFTGGHYNDCSFDLFKPWVPDWRGGKSPNGFEKVGPQVPRPGAKKPEQKLIPGEIYGSFYPAIWTGSDWLFSDCSTAPFKSGDENKRSFSDDGLEQDLTGMLDDYRGKRLVPFFKEYIAYLEDDEIISIMNKMTGKGLVSAYREWARNKFARKTK